MNFIRKNHGFVYYFRGELTAVCCLSLLLEGYFLFLSRRCESDRVYVYRSCKTSMTLAVCQPHTDNVSKPTIIMTRSTHTNTFISGKKHIQLIHTHK